VRRLVALVIAASAAAFVVAGGACSHGKKNNAAKAPSSTTTTAAPQFKLLVAAVDSQSMKPGPSDLAADVRAKVVETLTSYLTRGVVEPLQTGQAPVGLDAVFTPLALARLTAGSPDRESLLEDTRPDVGALAPEKLDVSLTALAGPGGEAAVVSAKVDWAVLFTMPGGRLRIQRTGELVLLPMPEGWRIDSYDLVAKRDTVPLPPATTTTGRGA
jgi:hypothetical protein